MHLVVVVFFVLYEPPLRLVVRSTPRQYTSVHVTYTGLLASLLTSCFPSLHSLATKTTNPTRKIPALDDDNSSKENDAMNADDDASEPAHLHHDADPMAMVFVEVPDSDDDEASRELADRQESSYWSAIDTSLQDDEHMPVDVAEAVQASSIATLIQGVC